MFSKSLDSKPLYINDDGVEMIDIMQGIYNGMYDYNLIHSVYRANLKCTMRPDYLALCLYGDEAYTEIAMKSSMLSNPFALEKGDFIYAMSIDNIYSGVKDTLIKTKDDSLYELIKRYHKYIDPDKVPDTVGSEENTVKAEKNKGIEPNISKTGVTGVTIKNGKIYFGENSAANSTLKEEDTAYEQEITDQQSAVGTGSFPTYPSKYEITSTLMIDADNNLRFNLDDNIEESYTGNAGNAGNVTLKDGKIYFGDIDGDLEIPVDSDEIDCAKSGITLGTFLNSAVNSCNISVDDEEDTDNNTNNKDNTSIIKG